MAGVESSRCCRCSAIGSGRVLKILFLAATSLATVSLLIGLCLMSTPSSRTGLWSSLAAMPPVATSDSPQVSAITTTDWHRASATSHERPTATTLDRHRAVSTSDGPLNDRRTSVATTTQPPSTADTEATTSDLAHLFRSRMSTPEKALLLHCLKSLADALERANVTYFLYGGSLLGARRHRGIVPWDDDVDILANYTLLKEIESALRSMSDFEMYAGDRNRYKVYPRSAAAISGKAWKWPFVDICFFSENATHVYDKYPGLERTFIYAKADVFPLVYRPFDDLLMPSPANEESVLARNYDVRTCTTHWYSHKEEKHVTSTELKSVPCSQLYSIHPFIFRNSTSPPTREILKIGNTTLKEFILD